MKVLFTTPFIQKIGSLNPNIYSDIRKLQSDFEAMTPIQLLKSGRIRHVTDTPQTIYVTKVRDVRLYGILEHGPSVVEELFVFLDAESNRESSARLN